MVSRQNSQYGNLLGAFAENRTRHNSLGVFIRCFAPGYARFQGLRDKLEGNNLGLAWRGVDYSLKEGGQVCEWGEEMKLKNLVKLPEKRRPEEDPEQQGSPEDTANYEYNQAIDQIGNIEVSIKKLKEIINAYEKRNR